MECDRFLEEKLGGGESAAFRAHRAGCAACVRDAEEYAEILRRYREASSERWPGGVPRVRGGRLATWGPVAAAAAVMVGILVLLLGSPPVPPPAAGPEPTSVFTRIHLEPWDRGEARIARALDDAWRQLEQLERRPR
jgi:hypothetical protein